jgi:hypothetical protein
MFGFSTTRPARAAIDEDLLQTVIVGGVKSVADNTKSAFRLLIDAAYLPEAQHPYLW